MNFSQNKLVVSARPNEARRPGRPRKWKDDAARKRAVRAEQKAAERQKELESPAYWEKQLQAAGLRVRLGKYILDELGTETIRIESGGYSPDKLSEIDAIRQRDGLITTGTTSGSTDETWINGGGTGRRVQPKANPDGQAITKEPEIREAYIYNFFDARFLYMRICNHHGTDSVSFCHVCSCLALANGLAPFPGN